MAPRAMNGDEPSLASLIERSAELKRALVDFALSPRFERHLEQFMLEAADPFKELSEGEAIGVIDRFALQHFLPNAKTVLDQFLAGRPDLTAADREMLRGWRDLVEGIFEIRRKDRDSVVLLNLLDDLEYRTYSNMGPAAFRPLPKGGFLYARLVPIRPVPGAWLVSGSMSAYRKSDAAHLAQVALELATKQPELVYRNPEKIEQGWTQMRADRAAFVEFFGGDELILPPAEAEERISAYYRHRQEAALARQPARTRPRNLPGVDVSAFELPPQLADADTIGIIYDEADGLNFYNEYGCCAPCSPTRLSRPASATRTCCAGTCDRRRSGPCRSAAWPPPTRPRSMRCSGRSCVSRTSSGPSTARPRCAGESPGTTRASPVPASP